MEAATVPSGVRELRLDGTPPLYARLYEPPGTRVLGGAVLAHGLASQCDEFGAFPERLASRGLAVLAFDSGGHGRSGGERAYLTGAGHLADLERAVARLEAHSAAAAASLFLVGHSLGCVPALRLLARDGARFAGGVLMAPAANNRNVVGPAMQILYEALYAVARQVHRVTGIHMHVPYQFTYRHLYADPAAAGRAQAQGFLQRSISMLSYPYLIPEVDNVAVAAGVTVPALVVVGSEDQVIANDESRATFEALASADKEWVRVVGAGHSFLGDRGADETTGVICDWLETHARRAATS